MKRATGKFLGLLVAFLLCFLDGAGWLADARERNQRDNGFYKNHLMGVCSKDGDQRTHNVRGLRSSYGYQSCWNPGYIFNGPSWLRDTTFIYEGTPYFYYKGIYFIRIGNVFAAATPPFAGYTSTGADNTAYAELTDRRAMDTITIDVPAGERRVPVKLVRLDTGYVGPYGEMYPHSPTVDELKSIYGY